MPPGASSSAPPPVERPPEWGAEVVIVRLVQSRWVLPLTLLAILPLVVLGVLVVQRVSVLNEDRYAQEVIAARYAAELAGDDIRDSLRDQLRPWREALTYAHSKGQAAFESKLRKMFFTSPLVDVPQFVEESILLEVGDVEADATGDPHRCDRVVALVLRENLVDVGRARMGYDRETGSFDRHVILTDDENTDDTLLRWVHLDLDGTIAKGCPDCERQLVQIGASTGPRHFALLTVMFPLPGGADMRPGMFGAVVPIPALLRQIVAPSLERWESGQDALARHALRLIDVEGQLVLPADLPVDSPESTQLRESEALYAADLLGEGAPWQLQVVALSGFDAAQVRAESGRWSLLISLAALLLVLGAWLFTRSFLHQIESTRVRNHLLSNVGHELKTPLSLIRLYSETLETGRARTDADRAKFLGIIGREAKRLTHLIDNILDVQRIEEDRKQYSFAQVRPDRVVRDTVEAYRFQLTEQGFDLRLDIDDELPLVYIDEDALAQALINLLDNAAKYSDTVKDIRVRLARERADGHDAVCLHVQDRGIGIPDREQQKIFESFYRVQKSDVHDVKGSGLGLAVVAHVARAHGGRVVVDSTPGRGSTFTLCVPLDFEPASE